MDSLLRCTPPKKEEYAMSTRRRFSTEFKAKVALEALRGDQTIQTIQEIAARHQERPNQVSVWKQRAVAGMKEVCRSGAQHT